MAKLAGAEIAEDFVERDGGGDDGERVFRGDVIGDVVMADAGVKERLHVVGVRAGDTQEPLGGVLIILFFPVVEAKLKAGLRIFGVEANGLGEEAMAGGFVFREEAADVVFHGVDADVRLAGEKIGFDGGGFGNDGGEDFPGDLVLQRREVFEQPFLSKIGGLAEFAKIQDTDNEADSGFGGGIADDFERAEDGVGSIEFVGNFDDGGTREGDTGTEREALIGFGAVDAIQRDETFAVKGFDDVFGGGFAHPIDRAILRRIEEREGDRGIGLNRRGKQEQRQRHVQQAEH